MQSVAEHAIPCKRLKAIRSVSAGVHASLLRIIQGEAIPKKNRTSCDIAAYRIKNKRLASVCKTRNPLTGSKEFRVLIQHQGGHRTILLRTSEVSDCIKKYYTKYKGSGARKLHRVISKAFSGVPERKIQKYLNSIPEAQRLNTKFCNKITPKPVQSSSVLNQVQIDLVDMRNSPSSPADKPNITYKYILVVLDIFSRFIFLRPLESKSSTEVATRLTEIFSDTGPPARIQSDQGTEFKGSVQVLMKAMGVKIIHSRPYHPQSQGKVSWIRVTCR